MTISRLLKIALVVCVNSSNRTVGVLAQDGSIASDSSSASAIVASTSAYGGGDGTTTSTAGAGTAGAVVVGGAAMPPSCIGTCEEGVTYCLDWVGQCLPIGGCVIADDCANPMNQPYPVAYCVGNLECQDRECVNICDTTTTDTPTPDTDTTITDTYNDTDTDTDEDSSSWGCTANTDCYETEYCAQGMCRTSGTCTDDSDCWNPNHVFDDKRCVGYLTCDNEGMCDRICGAPCKNNDENDDNSKKPTTTQDDTQCTVTGCDTNSMCDGAVSCYPDRCSDDCAGIYFDTAGSVITECSTSNDATATTTTTTTPESDNDDDDDDLVVLDCFTSDDCPRGETIDDGFYCGSDNTCLPMGSCTVPDDCTNMENIFAMVSCIGTMDCLEGQCAMSCDTFDDPSPLIANSNGDGDDTLLPKSCNIDSNEDCDEDEYCSIMGMCLKHGYCDILDDCKNIDNMFPVAFCVGTLGCVDDQCIQICATEDEQEGDGIDTDDTWGGCTANADCLDTEYCAQGTCLASGMCTDDADCINPNHVFGDMRCDGYQYCGDDNYCTRNCGVACNGDDYQKEETQCTVTGCDTKIMCEGAVACVPDFCNECKAVYYDAAGYVVTECDSVQIDEGSPSAAVGEISSSSSTTACSSNDDCIQSAGEALTTDGGYDTTEGRDIGTYYCAQGTCMAMGSCMSASDCFNPINLFDDKRCTGYMTCDSDGLCDRICSETCKDGSQMVDCVVDPCSTGTSELCGDGAASCRVDPCGGSCTAVYYNAAGEILTDCDDNGGGDGDAAGTMIQAKQAGYGDGDASSDGAGTMERRAFITPFVVAALLLLFSDTIV